MANPTQDAARPRHSNLVKIIAIVLLSLIVLVGLAVLITWLAIRPKKLVYTIEDGSIHGFNLSHDRLTANFDFILRAHNPNHKVKIYYDAMDVSVLYDDQQIAFYTVEPFYQPRKNVTKLEVKPVANCVLLMRSVSKDLRLEKSSGVVELAVYLKAKIRFKVGMWKLRRRTLKIRCKPVLVPLSSSKHFERVHCDVDL